MLVAGLTTPPLIHWLMIYGLICYGYYNCFKKFLFVPIILSIEIGFFYVVMSIW